MNVLYSIIYDPTKGGSDAPFYVNELGKLKKSKIPRSKIRQQVLSYNLNNMRNKTYSVYNSVIKNR